MRVPTAAAPRVTAPAPGAHDDHSWREVVSSELLQLAARWKKEDMDSLARMARDTGNAMKGVWENLKDGLNKALRLPVLKEKIPESTREDLVHLAEGLAYGVGFTAAGVMGLAGVAKLRAGHRRNDRQRKLDGVVDLAAAATIAVSVAGLGPARAVLGPLAALLGVARGGYNATVGYRAVEPRTEIQGVLDGTRSFGTFCSLMSGAAGPLGVVAALAAPLAGAIQIGRGYHDLSAGLREGDNKKELSGLTDIGIAVGTTMALTGIGTIPGIVLTVASTGAKVAYQFHKGSRTRLDRVLDRLEPALGRAVERVDRAAEPLTRRIDPLRRKVVDLIAKRVVPEKPEEPTPAGKESAG